MNRSCPLLLLLFIPLSSASPLSWTSPQDPCYHGDGRPRHCLSELTDAAAGVPVLAQRLLEGPGTLLSSLTAPPHNRTCWTASEAGDWTLTVPLGRRFEVTYVRLGFCPQESLHLSVSVSILKSMDFGRSWRALQHYSGDCSRAFALPPRSTAPTKQQEAEPLCSDPRPLQKLRGGPVLAFSTLDGRPSSHDFHYSPALQDWVTATDIRVVFHRSHRTRGAESDPQQKSRRRGRGGELRRRRNHVPAPPALSDLQVGGRCACNGHASRCQRDARGGAVCVCEHHTSGPDCDVCEQFFCDRPWQRATPREPHPCLPCECNGHSASCRFSMAVYQQSGRVSGGVCLKCRHHTTGRHCQFCQNGFMRDHSKPLNHRKTCQPCRCHAIGAVGVWCNQETGQCLCRDGVTGQRCNHCAAGFKPGRSPVRPCIRVQEVTPPTPVYQPQYSIDEECVSYCPASPARVKMDFQTFCVKDYVLKVQVKGQQRSGPWWQLSVRVQAVFRSGSGRVLRGQRALWVPERDLGCGCPALQTGRTFLLIGAELSGRSWAPEERRLVADRSTAALQWREHWGPKLRGFRGQEARGRCPTHARSGPAPQEEEYTPPHLLKHNEQ